MQDENLIEYHKVKQTKGKAKIICTEGKLDTP